MHVPVAARSALLLLALATPAIAQTHLQRLTASDGVASDFFGAALALDGDVLAVGAPYVGPDKGAVYVFERAGGPWVEVAKLEPGSVPGGMRFGSALALEGERLLVGAPAHPWFDGPSGFVIVYERVGGVWVELERLHASDAESGDRFGTALALDGDALLVGASGHDRWGSDTGAAYAFKLGASWNEVQVLRPRRAGRGMAFGGAVALEGRRCVVTAPSDREGSAHAFRRTHAGWRPEAELRPSDGRAGDLFGHAVVLTERWAIVRAYDHGCIVICHDAHLDYHAGTLYAFELGPQGFGAGVELVGHGNPGYFCRGLGHDLAFSEGRLLSGAPGSPYCQNPNAAFLFRSDATGEWPIHESALLDSGGYEGFGWSVAIDGSVSAIGVPGASPSGPASGAVDVFEL